MHHLADPLQHKRLQPHHGHVPFMFEGEVLDHVRPGHRQSQLEEQDLLKLQTQKGKVVGKNLSLYFMFFIPVRKFCLCFGIWTTLVIPDDSGSGHMKQFVGE